VIRSALLLILFIAFAGIYPSLTVRGYYEGRFEWFEKTEVEYVEIGDTYIMKGDDEYPDTELPYHLKPLQRLIWVKIDLPDMEYVPVKMGWNKIYQPVLKVGLVEFKKIGEPASAQSVSLRSPLRLPQ
jgi:hypothetical protein